MICAETTHESSERHLALMIAALDTVGTDQPWPEGFEIEQTRTFGSPPADPPPPPYSGRVHVDPTGTWDEQHPGTDMIRGDFMDTEGTIWRRRPPQPSPNDTPPEAYGHAVRTTSAAEQKVRELEARFPEGSPEVDRAREIHALLMADRRQKLKAAEAWEAAGNYSKRDPLEVITPSSRTERWREIDTYRKTTDGRRERNASRRKVKREGYADLSNLTPEEKAQHRREQMAAAKRAERARKKNAQNG